MLRKNKIIMFGKDNNGTIKFMESDNIYRNFAPESYLQTIISEIHNSDIPDYETSCAYNFYDKVVKFDELKIEVFQDPTYIFNKKDLFDYMYIINTCDVHLKLGVNGDCTSDNLKAKGLNLAPRTILVLRLDRTESFNVRDVEGEKKKVFYKNTSDVNINLEYNIYMTRLL